MATIRPPTRSHAYLVLPYTANGALHRMALRTLFSVDPMNTALFNTQANAFAPLIAACMPTAQSLSTYEVYDEFNSYLYGGSLNASYPGTKGSVAGMRPDKSITIAFTGKGNAAATGYAVGQTRLTFRVLNAHSIDPGDKRIPFGTELLALANALRVNPYLWADFYGQKASVRAGVTVQHNAHIQRKEGT
jgi:hypothetical protein